MSETKRKPKERAADYVGALHRAKGDRGKLAALRRGLTESPRMRADAWPVIASLGGDIGQPVFVAIGGLFATHPAESDAANFGETCRNIALAGGKEIPVSFEQRFRRLLASGDEKDVIGQLRAWVRLAASRGVGVNYEGLFADVWNWRWYAEDIRVKWARSFWRSGEGAENEVSNPGAI